MNAHTAGPWIVERPKPSERWVTGVEEGTGRRVLVAACETDDDAALIATVPQMVARLETQAENIAYLQAEVEHLRRMCPPHLRRAS